MERENLWGTLPSVDKIKTPLVILQDQAALLGDITNNQLVGYIEYFDYPSKGLSEARLYISVPALQNYKILILSLHFSYLEIYPVRLRNTISDNQIIECKNEDEFKTALQNIFTSEHVQKIITALLVQIKAA